MAHKCERFETADSVEKQNKAQHVVLTRWRMAVVDRIERSFNLASATGALTTLSALVVVTLGASLAHSDSLGLGAIVMGVGLATLDAGRRKAVAAARARGLQEALSTIFSAGDSTVIVSEKHGQPHATIHKKRLPVEMVARRAAIMEVALQEILDEGEPKSVERAKKALRAIQEARSIS